MRVWSGIVLVALALASCGGSAERSDAATDSSGAAGAGGSGGSAGQPAAGGAAGNPPISGLTIWLDATRGVDSSTVRRWADQSGNGADATATMANSVLGEDPFSPGRPALYFTVAAAGTRLYVTPTPGTDWGAGPFLLEVVARHSTAGAAVASFWASGSADTPPNVRLLGNEGMTVAANFAVIAQGSTMSTRLTTGAAVSYNDHSIHSFGIWRDDSGNISLLLDGITIMSGRQTEAITSSGAATIGPFQGQLFEVVGKKGVVTSAEVAAVESYFKNRYGTP